MIFPDFDLNLYKSFVAVYESKNITRAADKLVLTPSAVGMRIKELERQLGNKLFLPHRRGVHPTKEADELFTIVHPALAAIFGAHESIKEFSHDTIGTIRIGCQASVALYHLADFISTFIANHPNLKLEIYHKTKQELSQLLVNREIDIVISTLPFSNKSGSLVIEKLEDVTKAFYATTEFLKKNNLPNHISIKQLCDLPLLLPSKQRDDTKMLLAALGPAYTSYTEVAGSNEFIYAMIKRHVGIGYVTPSCIEDSDGIEKIIIDGVKLPSFNLSVIYNKIEPSKLIKAFLTLLKNHF